MDPVVIFLFALVVALGVFALLDLRSRIMRREYRAILNNVQIGQEFGRQELLMAYLLPRIARQQVRLYGHIDLSIRRTGEDQFEIEVRLLPGTIHIPASAGAAADFMLAVDLYQEQLQSHSHNEKEKRGTTP